MKTNFDLLLSKRKGFKVVVVQFGDSRRYYYKTCIDISANDFIIVPARNEFFAAKVLETITYAEYFSNFFDQHDFDLKWVVSKVDFSIYDEMQNIEKSLYQAEQQLKINKMFDMIAEQIGKDKVKSIIGSDDDSNIDDGFLLS